MADEKKIRVSVTGDASGLNKEIDRAGKEMKKAFSDVSLEDVIDTADRRFSKLSDKMKAIGDELNKEKKDTNTYYGRKISEAPDQKTADRLERENERVIKKQDIAWDKWSKLANLLETAIKRGVINDNGEATEGENAVEEGGEENEGKRGHGVYASRRKATLMSRMMSRASTGNISGAAKEGIIGESGLLAGMGVGLGTIGILSALGVVLERSIRLGYEGVKLDNKISARKDYDFNKLSGQASDVNRMGLSINEFKEFTLQQMQTMKTYDMDQAATTSEILHRVALKRGFGLNDSQVSEFDQFKQQDNKSANSTGIIADILARSQKEGILGVSKSDFSLLPQKIETVSSLLSQQKSNNEKIDSSSMISLMMAGQKIGGRFADDRAADSFGRIGESIKSPSSVGMKAYIFDALRRAHPNESYTDLLARQEGGNTQSNLTDVFSQMKNMHQGEYRRMVLYQFTKNWQDAIRLDKNNGISDILNSQRTGGAMGTAGVTTNEINSQFDKAKNRAEKFTTIFEDWMSKIETTMTEKVGRPIVEAVENLQTSDVTKVLTATPGGWNTAPAKTNKIIKGKR